MQGKHIQRNGCGYTSGGWQTEPFIHRTDLKPIGPARIGPGDHSRVFTGQWSLHLRPATSLAGMFAGSSSR